jgi:hypothetical protein
LEENYRLDVRPRPRLPRGRGFTRGRVFTVRRRGKNRVRTDMGVLADAPPSPPLSLPPLPSPLTHPPLYCPRGRWAASARTRIIK